MTQRDFHHAFFIALMLAGTFLSGCSASPEARNGLAQDIALGGHLTAKQVVAQPYLLTSYDRVTAPGQPADVYIEGDGLAWTGRTTKSPDPTPTDPLALRLAAIDPAANVIYLARPCQYTKMSDSQQACDNDDWTNARFSDRVVNAMSDALDQIKAQTKVSGFNLIGYSGGGGIAALLSAGRSDVLSLRTVAGNLDHVRFNANHRVSPMTGSVNPRDVADKTLNIPQLHFIGADDEIVTPDIFQSFHDAAVSHAVYPPCIRSEMVPGASHGDGWVERWPELLRHSVSCAK
ncbi:MAG: uncharacterized protein JWO78_465 [Micavibrio sp.]|nr:uncharacterized protein [Micavibrio sp.]